MKKILTLLLVLGALTAVQAQTREDARRVILGGGGNDRSQNGGNGRDVILGGSNNGDNYPSGSRDAEIDRINRDYDNKIQSIRNNPYLSSEEKQRAIRQLERGRQERIRQIDNYDRRRGNDDRYDRGNNGKHKGWNKKQKNKNWKKGKNKDRNWDDD